MLSKRRVVLMHYSRVVSKTSEEGAKGQEVGGKPRRVRVLKALTTVVVLVLVFALVQLFQRWDSEAIYGFDADSTLIVRQSQELGPGIHLLLPNLRGARVVVPARPHDPREFQDPANRRKLQRRSIETTSWRVTAIVTFVSIAGLSMAESPAALVLWSFVWGAGIGANWVAATSRLQRLAPDRLMGRLASIDFLLLTAGETVIALLAAYLGEWFGDPTVAGWTGFIAGVVSWLGLQALMWARKPAND